MRRPDVFTLDQGHPLAQGLVTAWLGRFPGAARSFNEITGQSGAVIGNATWGDVLGRNGVYANAMGAAIVVPRPALPSAEDHTISWCINARGQSFNSGTAAFGRHFEDSSMNCNFYNTLGSQIQFNALGFASTGIALGASIYNAFANFSLVITATSATMYFNATPVQNIGGTKAAAAANNTYLLNRADLGRTCNAGISDFLIHNRALSPAEIALLADRTDPMLGGLIVEERPVLWFDIGGSTAVTGTMAFTESGSDTFAATGQILISGLMSVTETGDDTISASGAVLVQGTLSATETGADTFVAYGGSVAPVTGTMAVTESEHDTATIIGQLLISGLMSVSEVGDDVFAAVGVVTDTAPITAAEVARTVIATARMKTVTASARVKQVRYEVARA